MEETAADGTVARKADHVRINLESDVSAKGVGSGFDEYRFVNCALPEIDLDEVDTSTTIFGRKLSAPILISCMTGGTEEASRINHVLATLAQERRLAMAGVIVVRHDAEMTSDRAAVKRNSAPC